uniref:Troponin I n=1 Tax=Globodera rostochiensis TaxID=31243 RepID=A0A914GXL9_GLORO
MGNLRRCNWRIEHNELAYYCDKQCLHFAEIAKMELNSSSALLVRGLTGDEETELVLKAERERKKAEVRKRLEEAGRAKKAKKGFLTPERKKKLRKLLMLKATEDLKLQQQQRAEERQKVLNDRIPLVPDNFEMMSEDQLLVLGEQFRQRILSLEDAVYDLSYTIRQKDFEINELTIAVNDLRGKFVKPTLKRISKMDSQFDKIKKQNAAKVDYRSTLKNIGRDGSKFSMIEEDSSRADTSKAEWMK